MSFSVVRPAPQLRPFIARYWSLRASFAQPEQILLLPDAGMHLLVVCGEPVASRHFQTKFGGDRVHLVGAMLRADHQVLSGDQHLVGVSFEPAGFARFHPQEVMRELSEQVQPFDGTLPQIDPRLSLAELAPLFDRHWLERLRPPRSEVSKVLTDIAAARGRVRVDALMRRHAMTGRTLERHFAREVGITPKELIDLTRFRAALAAVEGRGHRSLMEIAWDCGYYDHAHLTREFRRFTGEAPSRTLLSDLSKSAAG